MTSVAVTSNNYRVDRLQLVALLGLMLLGGAFVYSASMVTEVASTAFWYTQSCLRQSVWSWLATCAAGCLCLVDYRTISRWSFIICWITILLLALVLIPGIGSLRFGARRWI